MSAPAATTSPPAPQRQLVGWCVAGVLMFLSIAAIGQVSPVTEGWDYKQQNVALTLTSMVAGVLFLSALWCLRRSSLSRAGLLWIVGIGLAMRLVLFVQPPAFETDYFRFMWDGAVAAHGENPFASSPDEVIAGRATPFTQRPELIALREAGLPTLKRVNHPHLTTIYPPVAQAFFAAAYRISPFDPNAIRVLLLATEVATLILLAGMLRHLRLPMHWIAIYWWNPIAIKEFYLAVHVDAVVALLAFAAMCAAVWGRRWLGIALLGMAIGTKLWPIVLAPLMLRYRAASARQVLSGLFVLAMLSALLTWPLLASWGRDSASGVTAYANHWISNAGFFAVVDYLIEWTQGSKTTLNYPASQAARPVAVAFFLLWLLVLATRRLPDARALVRWSMLAVGGLFLISPTQFPWYYTWALPFLALWPSVPLLLYSALLPLYHLQYDQPWVLWVEHLPVWLLIAWALLRHSSAGSTMFTMVADREFIPPAGYRVSVIIPALNEEQAIGKVIANVPSWVTEIIVVDNGSSDGTADVARQAGARVIAEPQRGYGSACLAGLAAMDRPDVVVFMDGDFSDSPQEMARLVEPIARNEADMVIGSRVLGQAERGSLTPQQRFGNALACRMIRLLYGVRYTDLGPFRAIHAGALKRLSMDDRDYGWTVQMQVRAARQKLRSIEVPVSYRRRIGVSKISGTVRGVFAAGTKIISTILREGLRQPGDATPTTDQVIVMARYPEPGKAKTRLIPLLGPTGAALLHRQLVTHTLAVVRGLACRRSREIEVRFTGASQKQMAALFGSGATYRHQSDGDLGERLHAAAAESFARGMRKVILIGTDCPTLDADILEQAFRSLDEQDVVLGPAVDGGYYLIGMRASHKALFEQIDWGGPKVLAQTIGACQRVGAHFTLLQELCDVDSPADLAAWAGVCLAKRGACPQLSIVIPARNEEDHIAATIASALTAKGIQIIIVDAHSSDRTAEIARAFNVECVSSIASRGLQLNIGAAMARSESILFLHADTRLPFDYEVTVRQMLSRQEVAAGAFEFAIDAAGWAPRLIEFGVKLRSRWWGRPYGDQAMFMSRRAFEACDGFPNLPFMEDYAMLSRLRVFGAVCIAEIPVVTAARRWDRFGWWYTTARHQWMILRFLLGAGPKETEVGLRNRLASDTSCKSNDGLPR